VNTTDKPELPSHGQEFIPLARECKGWENLQSQQVWLGTMEEAFVAAEPRPLCAFLSGNFKDWCEVSREPWRGMQEVLKHATCRCGLRAGARRAWRFLRRLAWISLGLPPLP
jgi:hypothetical protein